MSWQSCSAISRPPRVSRQPWSSRGRCWTRSTSRRATRTAIPKGRRSSTTAHFRARRHCALPVRSLSSSVVVWPDRAAVESALRLWAEGASRIRRELVRVGYFGSYARGDWGVGSDLDVVLVVAGGPPSLSRRPVGLGLPPFPVPPPLLVFTQHEWRGGGPPSRFTPRVVPAGGWGGAPRGRGE